MSDNDNSSNGSNANGRLKSVISKGFNRDNKLGKRIANASPKTQEKIRNFEETKNERLREEPEKLRLRHQFRVNKLKIELHENQHRNPALIPNNPKATEIFIQEIDNTAERMITEKENIFLKNISREADKNIDFTLRQDMEQQKEQALSRTHDKNAHEHDREH